MGYEHCTPAITKIPPAGTLTTWICSLWCSAGMMIYVLKVVSLTNRLNATVLGFSHEVIFSVGSAAKKAVATSGVSAGIGLVLNFWYQLLYNGITAAKSQVVLIPTLPSLYFILTTTYGPSPRFRTYFFFYLCCRLPIFFMLAPSIALLALMFFVSFHAWPQAVFAISFLEGVLVTLQYLLFGTHRIVLGIRWVPKRIGAVFVRFSFGYSHGGRSGNLLKRRRMLIH